MKKILAPFGMVFVSGAFVLLFWNEGRTVQTAKSLKEGARAVVSVSADKVDPANEGKLVHMTGEATTTETLSDPDFGISVRAIKLERQAEMYQWKEETASHGGSNSSAGSENGTTYNYSLVWSPTLIQSSSFKEHNSHENPHSMLFKSQTETAKKVTLGSFTLSDAQVDMLIKVEDFNLDEEAAAASPAGKAGFKLNESGYYKGADPSSPAVGDIRVAFKVVRPAAVSIVARQISDTFEPFQAKAGGSILLVSYGTMGADSMFHTEEESNVVMGWALRFAGLLMMVLGIFMVFRPFAAIANWFPFFGTVVGAGILLFAAILGTCLTIATIALSWLYFRPLFGIGLLVLAGGGLLGLINLARGRNKQGLPAGAATTQAQ
ncbi:MAG TPA: TMEM43 family protein [Terriglobia bacterium]|nr:TMEM43 family protein [Terriglobia bacterium]